MAHDSDLKQLIHTQTVAYMEACEDGTKTVTELGELLDDLRQSESDYRENVALAVTDLAADSNLLPSQAAHQRGVEVADIMLKRASDA
jgi:hypothetical protein